MPPTPPLPPLPPLAGMRSDSGGNAQVSRERKPANRTKALQVDADRTVETIVAGAIGNSRPIESVVERYYSPELKMTVFSRRSDPRNGESIYRMVDIKRSEPDAALFRAGRLQPQRRQEVVPSGGDSGRHPSCHQAVTNGNDTRETR